MVSSKAKTCPHCGAKLRKSAWRIMWAIISIILCIVMLGLLNLPHHQQGLKPSKADIEAWIKAESEKYAKESFAGTTIVYKKIVGIKKESASKDDYTVAVVVDIPDYNDRVLILEIKRFEDQYTLGWDTRSATLLVLLKAGKELEQITP